MIKKVVYPGSFDPLTLGHLDIIERASKLYDEVIVTILKNVNKTGMFSYEDRLKFIKKATRHLKNVTVKFSTGLLVDFLKENNVDVIIKGLRNSNDFIYEFEMSQINKTLDPNVETVFLVSDPKYQICSSTTVRELLKYKANISKFVPKDIIQNIEEISGYKDESIRFD